MTGEGLIVIPFIDCWQETHQATLDARQQLEGKADLLLIDQGSGGVAREGAEMLARTPSLRLWRHTPPMPSLAATWNAALDYAWELGHQDCMVWNNDIRVAPQMYAALRKVAEYHNLWFTTPVNVGTPDNSESWIKVGTMALVADVQLGGPDFSCFLISQECHQEYRFDERFLKAYFEDNQYVRKMWLGGDGNRIAGVTLPYLHYGSRTSQRSPEAAAELAPFFERNKQLYAELWGGPPHHERYLREGDPTSAREGVGTPGGVPGYLPEEV